MNEKTPVVIIEKHAGKRQKKILSLLKKQNGQTLILVPEVSMLAAWEQYGTLYHAGLKSSEKKDIWKKVQSGEIQTVIGTQKALFLPFKNLSAICIEEEQYETYKLWEQYPRLNTIRGARALADVFNAQVIYASSYPSLSLRYAIQKKECEVIVDSPVVIKSDIIPFSFEDRKWKRALPNDAGTKIRSWARGGKKVLVLYNKKDNQKVREVLHFHLSKKAKENMHLGTTSLLTLAGDQQYDHVVWIAPELTLKAIDYRSSERARLMAARLQGISPKQRLTIITRSAEFTAKILQVSDEAWYENVLKERRLLNLPPYTDLVRLTVCDKDAKKVKKRGEGVAELLGDTIKKIPDVRVFGPFQEKGPKRSKLAEYHILLSGDLDTLVPLYHSLPIDSADLDPHRIV